MRELSKNKYLIAGIATFLLFGLGLALGVLLSGQRIDYSSEQIQQQQLELDSLQMQYQFINSLDFKNNCAAITKTFEVNVKSLINLGNKIEKYSSDVNFDADEFNSLKREYTLAQLRYWFLTKKAKEACGTDVVSVIYFYSNEADCFSCSTQSRILTHLKGIFENKLLIFSFDGSFENEPMIPIMEESYNITSYPSLVIDDDVFQGLSTEQDLLKELCSRYKEKPASCL